MENPQTYEVTTIKDIFDKIPIEKMEEFFSELRVLMVNADFARSVAIDLGGGEEVVQFPESVTWVDDGKGEIELQLGPADGDDLLVMKSTVGKARGEA